VRNDESFFSVALFVPLDLIDSHMRKLRRRERLLAGPLKLGASFGEAERTSRRLWRLLRRSFELRLDLNRPSQPRLSDLGREHNRVVCR
jgi:hypothetical protein